MQVQPHFGRLASKTEHQIVNKATTRRWGIEAKPELTFVHPLALGDTAELRKDTDLINQVAPGDKPGVYDEFTLIKTKGRAESMVAHAALALSQVEAGPLKLNTLSHSSNRGKRLFQNPGDSSKQVNYAKVGKNLYLQHVRLTRQPE